MTEAQQRSRGSCDRGGSRVDDVGPCSDRRCVVRWGLPGSTATGAAIYQLDVTPDGRYVADGDGPQPVNGFSHEGKIRAGAVGAAGALMSAMDDSAARARRGAP